jgi:hypothetical protein
MNQAAPAGWPAEAARLLEPSISYAIGVAIAVTPGLLSRPTPCREWAARMVAVPGTRGTKQRQNWRCRGFGHLYGPGSFFSPNGYDTRQELEGKFPIAGKGGSVLSFTHADEAASAVVAALDNDVSRVLNIVDDMPVTIREWLPAFAYMLGAPAPKARPGRFCPACRRRVGRRVHDRAARREQRPRQDRAQLVSAVP